MRIVTLFIIFVLPLPNSALAADERNFFGNEVASNEAQLGIETGSFLLFGLPDFQVSYRPERSNWIFGYRFFEFEGETDLFGQDVDEWRSRISGPNVRYVFSERAEADFFASAGLYERELEVECKIDPTRSGDASDSTLFAGGGMIFDTSPSVKLNLTAMVPLGGSLSIDAGRCGEITDHGLDALLSMVFLF